MTAVARAVVASGSAARHAMRAAGLHCAGRFATPLRCSGRAGSAQTRSASLRSNSARPLIRSPLRCSAAQRRPAARIACRARGSAGGARCATTAGVAARPHAEAKPMACSRRRLLRWGVGCAGGRLWVAEERRLRGLRARAPCALRHLAHRGCLNGAAQQRSEFRDAAPEAEHRKEARRADPVKAPSASHPPPRPRHQHKAGQTL